MFHVKPFWFQIFFHESFSGSSSYAKILQDTIDQINDKNFSPHFFEISAIFSITQNKQVKNEENLRICLDFYKNFG